MPKVITIKSARKDYPESNIKKGDTYYKWKFNFGPEHKSKTYPRRSQLTQSDFLGQLYDLQDDMDKRFSGLLTEEEIQSELDTLKDDIQNLLDEVQERFDGMPDQLRENSSSGEILQERIDALDGWIADLDSVDVSFDEDLTEEEKAERAEEIILEITSLDCGL